MNVTYNEVFCGCFFQIKDVTNCDIVGVFDLEKGTVWSMLLVLSPRGVGGGWNDILIILLR